MSRSVGIFLPLPERWGLGMMGWKGENSDEKYIPGAVPLCFDQRSGPLRSFAGGDSGLSDAGRTVVFLMRAGQGGALAVRFYEYADVFEFAALTTFASALIGSLLMEDLLRYYGE